MPENVENWWRRRQRSKGSAIPYPIGTYRGDWERFPVLVRQFHPDLNGFVTLTQIPPAADVYLLWECESGHRFVATPGEQRERPGRTRRRSSWCPECTERALGRPLVPRASEPRTAAPREPAPRTPEARTGSRRTLSKRGSSGTAPVSPATMRRPWHPSSAGVPAPGCAFVSPIAPKPASAAEAELRAGIAARLDVDLNVNAVRVRRPFHGRFEVWPDIVIAELMIAIEYDTTGRSGTEHVGEREKSDRQKDRLLREAGWEVVRIRTSKLPPLGPFDVRAGGVSATVIDRILDCARGIRGDLIVAAYERDRDARN